MDTSLKNMHFGDVESGTEYSVIYTGGTDSQDAYGYVLTQSVKQVMDISESTLYPVLRRLQKDGLLSTYDQPFSGRLRRYYALTDAGRDKLNEYRAEWKAYTLRVNSLLYGGNNNDAL